MPGAVARPGEEQTGVLTSIPAARVGKGAGGGGGGAASAWSEEKERQKYQTSQSFLIGQENRIKCSVRDPTKQGGWESLYFVLTETLFVLVRPDLETPFWAVPAVVEPLRNVQISLQWLKDAVNLLDPRNFLGQARAKALKEGTGQYSLKLEISNPSSAFLRPTAQVQGQSGLSQDQNSSGATVRVNLELHFSDDRRLRACAKILAERTKQVRKRLVERLELFLSRLSEGDLGIDLGVE